jgi:hypothetical protein
VLSLLWHLLVDLLAISLHAVLSWVQKHRFKRSILLTGALSRFLRDVVVDYFLVLPVNLVEYLLDLILRNIGVDRFLTNDGAVKQNLNRGEAVTKVVLVQF